MASFLLMYGDDVSDSEGLKVYIYRDVMCIYKRV